MATMKTFIALYRGINVGGHCPVKMEALRAVHAALGQQDVRTYVQSGNVVFRAQGSAAGIARDLAKAFATEFGFAAKLLVRTAADWQKLVASNLYGKAAAEDPTKIHAAICDSVPCEKQLRELLTKTGGPEQFTIAKGILYLHAPDGFGRSKFAAGMERTSGVDMTVRNWRTVEALDALARALA